MRPDQQWWRSFNRTSQSTAHYHRLSGTLRLGSAVTFFPEKDKQKKHTHTQKKKKHQRRNAPKRKRILSGLHFFTSNETGVIPQNYCFQNLVCFMAPIDGLYHLVKTETRKSYSLRGVVRKYQLPCESTIHSECPIVHVLQRYVFWPFFLLSIISHVYQSIILIISEQHLYSLRQ